MMRIRGVWTDEPRRVPVGVGMYSSFVLIPQFVEAPTPTGYGFGASVTQAGLFLVPATIVMLLSSARWPAGWRTRVGARVPLVLGSIAIVRSRSACWPSRTTEPWEIYVGSAHARRRHRPRLRRRWRTSSSRPSARADRRRDRHEHGHAHVGGSVGSQVGASVIAGTVVGHALPTEQGFTLAFMFAAAACGLAALASLAVPRPGTSAAPAGAFVAEPA